MSTRQPVRSAAAEAYRALYFTPEWRALRKAQLEREPWCARCLRIGKRTAATIVNHKRPHRGDLALFRDPANHESSCKPHHDSNAQKADNGRPVQAIGRDGWPLPPTT